MKRFWNRKANGQKGFTLVELIVVIAILIILAAILIPVVSGYIKDAQDATGLANARSVYSAACAYVAKSKTPGWTGGAVTSPITTGLDTYLGSSFTSAGAYSVTLTTDGDVDVATWTPTGGTAYTYPA